MAKLSKHHQALEDSAESEAARLAEIERVLWDTAKVGSTPTTPAFVKPSWLAAYFAMAIKFFRGHAARRNCKK